MLDLGIVLIILTTSSYDLSTSFTLQSIRTQFVEVNHHQADLLLWCYEQMSIDLSDNEMAELEPLITQLEEIAN